MMNHGKNAQQGCKPSQAGECHKPDPCACDGYTKDEIDALLTSKVDKQTAIIWNELEMVGDNTPHTGSPPSYMKDSSGWVHINGLFTKSSPPTGNEVIARLPAGLAPDRILSFPITQGVGSGGVAYATFIQILTYGAIRFTSGAPSVNFHPGSSVCLNACFKVLDTQAAS